MRWSIVVPIHNEAGFLPDALTRLADTVEGLEGGYEVVLVENGSTDGTAAVARSLADGLDGFRVLELARPDYGAALRAGFVAAAGEWVVSFDIDYFSREFLDRVEWLATDADIVLASKRDPGAEDRRVPLRRLGTRVFNLLLRTLFGSGVTDTHGMKALRAAIVAEIEPQVVSNLDLFDTELVLRAEKAGYRIAEVPARVEELRRARSSYLKRVPRTLAGLAQVRRRFRREGLL